MPDNPLERLSELDGQANVIEEFDKQDIDALGVLATEEYKIDRESRAEWEKTARDAMKAVLQDKEKKNYPFPGASNVRVPLLTTAALQFAARAYPAIVQSPKMVRSEIIGKDTDQKKLERGERVETYMSYQLMKEMKGWESDTDTLLHQIPAIGCAFRKVFYSFEHKRPDSCLIPAIDFVVNQSTSSLETVPRATHRFDLYPHEIQSRIRSGTFQEFDYKTASPDTNDPGFRPRNDNPMDALAPHSFLEQHRFHDLDKDGFAEPWIVTIHEMSEKVVRIAPNWDLQKATLNKRGELVSLPRHGYFVKYPFVPDPAGGFYDVGFGLLLKTLTDAIDTALNQMIDAGHLQNAGGGFIGSGLNLKKSELRFSPGVYHVVNAPGGIVKDAVVPMQHAGASETLMNLLVMLIDFGKQITAVQDILTGETSRAQPATTTLAQIEQGLKVFSAIYKRIFRALGEEYRLLYSLNMRYPDQDKYLKVLDWQPPVSPQMGGLPGMPPEMQNAGAALPSTDMQPEGMPPNPGQMPGPNQMPMQGPPVPIMVEDFSYDDCDINPVADSHMVTDMQRLAKAQILLELAGHPTIGPTLNQAEIGKRVLQASNIENIAEIMPPKQGPTPAEQIQMAGAQAELEDKKASAMLKQAQAQKAMAEAGTAGMEQGPQPDPMAESKMHLDLLKLDQDAVEKDRRFELDTAKMMQDAKLAEDKQAAEQQFQLMEMQRVQNEADRGFIAEREDAERDFSASREDAILDRTLQAQQAGRDAFEADRTSKNERERNERADYESDRSHEAESERADADRKLKLDTEKLRVKSKPAIKRK